MYDCYNAEKIISENNGISSVGGIIGEITGKGNVSNCYNLSEVNCNDAVGGIIGYANGNNIEIHNVYNAGDIVGNSNSFMGSLIGRLLDSTVVTKSYVKASSTNIIGNGSLDNLDVTSVGESNMKSQSFADELNQNKDKYSRWLYDSNENQGYPYLENCAVE